MRSRFIASLIIVASGLTACADTATPSPKTASSTSAEPKAPTTTTSSRTTEPATTAPEYPAGIDEFTEENAIKFVEFYIEVINYATQTGDTDTLMEYSSSDCSFCNHWVSEVKSVHESGGKFEGFRLAVPSPVSYESALSPSMVLKAVLVQADYTTIGEKGELLQAVPSKTRTLGVAVDLAQKGWTVTALGNLEGQP